MNTVNGSLSYEDYINLIDKKNIKGKNFSTKQIQPSSVDLTLSSECYEIDASFLSSNKKVRENFGDITLRKIDLSKKFLFKKNKTFLIKLNEELNLSSNIFGNCNPKSSTGRLDVFCRTIMDFSDEYEKIPFNYKGEMFLEVTSQSFDIEFQEGDSLNQMRLVYNFHNLVDDKVLKKFHNDHFLTLNNINEKISPNISNGLKIGVDLSANNEINAFQAKKNTPPLCFKKTKSHKISDYWTPIKAENNKLIIKKNNFYILKSKEKIQIPHYMAAEMIPYDTSLGDFRVHYAGFFDPGFGSELGAFAVLEVKTNEVSFLLEDNQSIARIIYEMLNKTSKKLYGNDLNSNYQHQSLALSKHFV